LNQKGFNLFKKPILIILFLIVQVSGQEFPKFLIRGSGEMFWNEGWGDKFYFMTFTQEEWDDIVNGKIPDFTRTLRHDMVFNPEVWYSVPILQNFGISIAIKYEHLNLELQDSIRFSWIHWEKALSADLNFYSVGIRLSHTSLMHPYIGANIGYCHGDLNTSHFIDPPDSNSYSILIEGDGGGIFYDFIGGIILPAPFYERFGMFIEGGFRSTPGWSEFEQDNAYGDVDRLDWLIDNDRRLGRMQGWTISAGLQIGIF
jgi:hypothetical protein